jgi:hypothetical protein
MNTLKNAILGTIILLSPSIQASAKKEAAQVCL